jgi:nitroimidazol reductase NimA-like FMN-containing flavoprotein (pyridoxamine 5'-phosphate oxidase superfamily)
MRRKDREITDAAELRGILERAVSCRVALADGDQPYLVPLSFALDGADVVLHSARAGRKLDILRRNPKVCFEVEEGVSVRLAPEPCDVGMAYRTVVGFGVAEEVEDAVEKARLLAVLSAKYMGGAVPAGFPERELARTVVLRVRVRELYGKRVG